MMIIDFETRSRCDLKAEGVDNYALDPSTDIICAAFLCMESDQTWLWTPADGQLPAELVGAIHAARHLAAHNARFDQLIWETVGVPDYNFPCIPANKWYCTSAQCRINALPAGLDAAGRALNAKHKKDHSGSGLIRKLSIPQKDGEFCYDPGLLAQMAGYCAKDAKATAELVRNTLPLSDEEQEDWQVNERINDRGVRIDRELATLATQYADAEREEIGLALSKLTRGAVTKVTQTERLLNWLVEGIGEVPQLTKVVDGETKLTLDANAREALLETAGILIPCEREAVEHVHAGGKASVAKFRRMLSRADPEDDRVRGAFVYAGAGQTKRYASRGLQLHNMARDCFTAIGAERMKALMLERGDIPKPVMHTLAKLIRPTLIPDDGKIFVVGDWAAIEARVLPWLANSEGGNKVLDVFKRGEDIYLTTAAQLGTESRQLGKVANLSLGFGGAIGAFGAMAKNYGLSLPEHKMKKVVYAWRNANPWAPNFWSELERAARKAVRNPGVVTAAGRVRYVYTKSLLGGTLICILPDDSTIQYPYCRFDRGELVAMKASQVPRADSEEEWPIMRLWGGFLAENVTQATAACLLRVALKRCENSRLVVVGHVHDEIICEVPVAKKHEAARTLQRLMELAPDWARGLPLKAVPVNMERYGK
jgi:DNA polymerase